ncbi:ribose transport system permease protein [Natronobacillus azotifigens]|uniref:ABC transporter permease n=1 Tax=Natronobacillus azotifigens TaxID=472978 RepID=A0A9J6RCK7_9BACI|nr:ABC transporter permease [Natronobacillus azotifigens]MCZ0703036.1 ABC transporter permease [Natronobacillus azotifigens]
MENEVKKKYKSTFKLGSQQLVALGALIVLYLYFFTMSPSFRSINTLASIFDSAYYIGFLAIGVTFVIATGGIDLSLGTVLITSALTGGWLYHNYSLPMWMTIIITILVGTMFGLLNGVLVAKLKIAPFIATLGTQMVARGLGSIITNVQTVVFPLRNSPDGWYKSIFKTSNNFPTGIFVLIFFAIVMGIILAKTKVGRYILALGSNEEATRLSGVNVDRYKLISYVISGFFMGLAGVAYASTYTTILPGEGLGFELDAIAGVIIGGTSLVGGVASITGTMIGVMIMAVLQTGLPYIGLQPHYQVLITGIVILVAVLADVYKFKWRK